MHILRRCIQTIAALLSNAYLLFPFTRNIYQGRLKSFCVPGLNCHSCPAATGTCPLGALQNFFANVRPSFKAGHFHVGLYVIGFLGILGSLFGSMPCAWLCPFGLFQELMYKIPSRKFGIPRILSWVKYVMLAFFVVLLPLFVVDFLGYGTTWFCKFVCPAGTLEGGLTLMILQPELRDSIGLLFYSKLIILFVLLVLMVFIRRPFCRIVCPLGAIYSLFNKFSVFKMKFDPNKCVYCDACYKNCPMGIKIYEGANQLECIRCLRCLEESCKFDAISIEFAGIPLYGPTKLKKEIIIKKLM